MNISDFITQISRKQRSGRVFLCVSFASSNAYYVIWGEVAFNMDICPFSQKQCLVDGISAQLRDGSVIKSRPLLSSAVLPLEL